MHLKEITLSGFKSFPKKTCFKLREGITSFVGPNGCGKSNIIDAIKWTLGEMSIKSLRAEGMEDLIFTGTEKRPAVGMAEVALVFENNGGIPTDYEEVEIKRRFFRSGDGEFLINNTQCRLRDIQNLFANTGLKSAILNQGLVEDFLISDSDLRREIFESISGIKRYRVDRKEAQNKLNSVSRSLEKVEVILNEKKKITRSLKREANRAKRYHKYKEELKSKSILLAKSQLFKIENELKEKKKNINKLDKKTDEIQSAISKLESEINIGEEELKEKREEYITRGNKIQDVQENTSKLRERKASNIGELRHIKNYTEDLPENIPAEIKKLQKEMEKIEKTEDELNSKIQIQKKKINEIEKQNSKITDRIQELKERNLSLTVKQEEQNLRLLSLKENLKEYKNKIEEEETKLKEFNSTIEKIKTDLTENAKKINETNNSISKFESEKATALKKLQETSSEYERLKKEIDFYKNRDIELSDEVRKINSKFNFSLLSDNITVKRGYEAAVEAVLGEKVKGAVGKFDKIKEALKLIKKESAKGGVFALESKEKTEKNTDFGKVVSGKFSHLLRKELSKYNFAESLEEALDKAKNKGGQWVTRKGDIINNNFIILSKDKEGILIRKAKQRELSKKKKEFETELEKLEQERTKIINQLEHLKDKLEEEDRRREKLVSKKAELEFEINRTELKKESIENNINEAKNEIEEINEKIEEEEKEKKNVEQELSLNCSKQLDLKKEKENMEEKLETIENRRRATTDEESEIRKNTANLKEGLRLIERKETLEKEIKELKKTIKKETNKLKELKSKNSFLNSEIKEREETLRLKKSEQKSMQEKKEELEKEISSLKMEASEEKHKKDSKQNEIFREFEVEINGEEVEIEEEIDESIEKLKKKIESLSPINPLALNQYEERKKELDEIKEECSDLNSSKKDIEETIEEIDRKAKRQFKEAISSIKEDFTSIYSKLSPGGEADIKLPSSNILESDIEILVRPKGKKLKSMELFSTGEKTLAAVALLLAIMRKRESPIYIMDEIDAPLDENNIERFNDILRDFSKTSQILIVTHNRATMEHADFIYGITMEEEGVSTALSIDVDKI